MASIGIRDISKSFGSTPVLRSLSLDIADGEFVTLLGPSGCGKTTLLRILAGLETADAGEIEIGGRPAGGIAPQDRGVALVFQNYALFPHLTVRENIELPLRLRKMSRLQRALDRFGLLPDLRPLRAGIDEDVARVADSLQIYNLLDRRPAQLSGGQRQRVALGRAMIRHPGVLLLDEPLSSLDSKLRVDMRAELTDLHRRIGSTFVLVTHDQTEAMTMSDRIAVVLDGSVAQFASPGELYADPGSLAVARFVGTPGINELPGTVDGDGRLVLEGGKASLLPQQRFHPAAQVTVAFRPEAISIVPGEVPGHLGATVRAVENLGPEMLVSVDCSLPAAPLVVRVVHSGPRAIRRGDRVRLLIDERNALVFAATGTRMRPTTIAHAQSLAYA